MLPTVRISHQLEGRTRLRVEERARDEEFYTRVARELAKLPGIDELEIRPLTGSIVVRHKLPLAQVTRYAKDHQLFETLDGPVLPSSEEKPRVGKRRDVPLRPSEMMTLSETVLMDQGHAQPRTHSNETREAAAGIGAMALLGAGVFQAMRGDVLPAALPLILQAMQVFRRKRPPVALTNTE